MRKKMSILLFRLLVMLLAVSMSGCSGPDDAPPQVL